MEANIQWSFCPQTTWLPYKEQRNLGWWGLAGVGEEREADVCKKKAKLVRLL